jgi:hypothetical protein
MAQEQKEFSAAGGADVIQVPRDPGVNVVAIDRVSLRRNTRSRVPFPDIAPQRMEHGFDHAALAMVRRWNVGEDDQPHGVERRSVSAFRPWSRFESVGVRTCLVAPGEPERSMG